MICGSCPECDAPNINAYAGPGVFQRVTCEHCGKTYWLRHSNIDPVAYTESGFAEEFTVNEATHTITRRAQ